MRFEIWISKQPISLLRFVVSSIKSKVQHFFVKIFNPQNDKRNWYRKVYLRSTHWAALRARKLAKHKVCEVCGKRRRLEPHHKQYRMIFDVTVEDLIAVCRECHREIHREIKHSLQASRAKKSSKKKISARLKAVNRTLGRPPIFPIMFDRHGIAIITTKILGRKFADLRSRLEPEIGKSGTDLIGCAVPLELARLAGVIIR